MWFLVVAVVTGSTGSSYPTRVDVFMERGFTSQASCDRAAERYKALQKLSRVKQVETLCEFQP